MSRPVPSQVPLEVTTKLSMEQVMGKLLAATQKPRGFSIMAHREIVGTVSRERVVLRRGTIRGWDLSRNYGEFRGRLVDQRGSVKLQGKFVETTGSWGDFWVALAVTLIAVFAFFWVGNRQGGAAFVGPGVFAFVVVFVVAAILWRLSGGAGAKTEAKTGARRSRQHRTGADPLRGAGQQRRNFLAEAELLTKDIKRVLND